MKTIGTIHHLSASGGTIICRCLAAMQEAIVLSEINPQSTGGVKYNPLCPLEQYQTLYKDLSVEELREFFLYQIEVVCRKAEEKGKKVVLRDHSHSDFIGPVREVRGLVEFLKHDYQLHSVITIRNPIDSFLGVQKAGWVPWLKSFDDYCCRYLKFADFYSNVEWFRYEDFVNSPDSVLQKICSSLKIPFKENYRDNLASIEMTGGSGRGGDEIAARPRQEVSPSLQVEIEESSHFKELCHRFGY